MYGGSLRAGPHKNDGCAAQTNPTPDLALTLTLTVTPTLTPTLSRSAGAVFSLRSNLKTLHVRAIKRLVHVAPQEVTQRVGSPRCAV